LASNLKTKRLRKAYRKTTEIGANVLRDWSRPNQFADLQFTMSKIRVAGSVATGSGRVVGQFV